MHGMVPARCAYGGNALIEKHAFGVAACFARVATGVGDLTGIGDQLVDRRFACWKLTESFDDVDRAVANFDEDQHDYDPLEAP